MKNFVQSASLISKRFNSCSNKIEPLIHQSKTLRHLHFNNITDYEQGLKIQNQFVRANLDYKKMESKILQSQKDVLNQGYTLSDYENGVLEKILDLKPFPTILTFEFNSVYTGGKREKINTTAEDIGKYEAMGCKYYQLDRGGQVTYHGPGQLVAYPIIDLRTYRNLPLKCYVSKLEESIINALSKNYKIESTTTQDTGVWVNNGDDKIASIGVNVRRSITSFGIALNVKPDLKYMNTFTMCGLPGKKATSILEFGQESTVKDAAFNFVKEFSKLLSIETVEHMNIDANDINIEEDHEHSHSH